MEDKCIVLDYVPDCRNTEIIFERVKTSRYNLDFSDRVVLSPAALNSKNNLIT